MNADVIFGAIFIVGALVTIVVGVVWEWHDHQRTVETMFFTADETAEHHALWQQHVSSAPGLDPTPIHDDLAMERLREGLATWGHEEAS